jgi:CRP-like cAMP-binding protein
LLEHEIIHAFPSFQQLSPAAVQQIIDVAICRSFPADDHLFFQEDTTPPVLFVHSGQVRVYRINPNGREQTLLIASPGESINLPLVFAAQHQAHANAKALTDCILISISQSDFLKTVKANNEIALWVLENISEKIRNLVELSHDLSLLSVRSRLAKFLLEQVNQSEMPGVHWTQEDIANQIGTVREIVSRNLRQFSNEGVITFERHDIQITDLVRLQDIANE